MARFVSLRSVAALGASWMVASAPDRRAVLTAFRARRSSERPDLAVVRLDAAARAVTEHFADVAAARSPQRSFEELCDELGVDPARVRERAAQLRTSEVHSSDDPQISDTPKL